jgi:hypothetical protein
MISYQRRSYDRRDHPKFMGAYFKRVFDLEEAIETMKLGVNVVVMENQDGCKSQQDQLHDRQHDHRFFFNESIKCGG